MSMIKTAEEILRLKEGGEHLSRLLREVRGKCVVGASTEALDALARQRMADVGGRPSFLGYRIGPDVPPFPGALCVSINDEVVHGLPIPDRTIQSGDIVGLDIGMWYQDLATDMATTVMVGQVDVRVERLVQDTRRALEVGLAAIRSGRWVSDIGAAIEDFLKPKRYGIVKDLVGHGVGHAVHEDPQVPNYREPRAPQVALREGMVLAIEPMITLGTWRVQVKPDQWTIVTEDHRPCAHFEVTIVVTKEGYDLITPWPDT